VHVFSYGEYPFSPAPLSLSFRPWREASSAMRLLTYISALLILSGPGLRAQAHGGVVPGSPRLGTVAVGQGGPTLIVLHGGPGLPHPYLRPLWDQLQTEGRVVFYDQRGCGLSEPAARYRWQDHVGDLDRVINHFSPGEPVILAGSSWGSTLALLYALEHPERVHALILSGTPTWASNAIGQVRVDTTLMRHLTRRCAGVARNPGESPG
jgi:pimeloyl-ACP methyl ester carboxylesterase